jgi:hypothetical protein
MTDQVEKPPEPEPKPEYLGIVECSTCHEQIGNSYLRGRIVIYTSLWFPGEWGSGKMLCCHCGEYTRVPFRARRVKHF